MSKRVSDVRFHDTDHDAALLLSEILNEGVRREIFRVGDHGFIGTELVQSARQVVTWCGKSYSIAVIEHRE